MKLKATKTKLYNLVKSYCPNMPSMKSTEYVKAYGRSTYWLKWYSGEAYLSPCAGSVRLILPDDKVVTIPVPELEKLGMIEHVNIDATL